jgi:hypothetical protein
MTRELWRTAACRALFAAAACFAVFCGVTDDRRLIPAIAAVCGTLAYCLRDLYERRRG